MTCACIKGCVLLKNFDPTHHFSPTPTDFARNSARARGETGRTAAATLAGLMFIAVTFGSDLVTPESSSARGS
jgi:hypothetical protein